MSERPPPPVHARSIRLEAVRSGPAELTVTGFLLDERPSGGPSWFGLEGPRTVHEMRVRLRVRYPDLVIIGVEAAMDAHPYTLCPDALPALQELTGLSVARGFTRAVNARLGRSKGCAHLVALVHAMAPVVKQAVGAAFRERLGAADDRPDLWFVDSCQAWREDGPLHALIRREDEAGLRALSAYPRRAGADPAPAREDDDPAASA